VSLLSVTITKGL